VPPLTDQDVPVHLRDRDPRTAYGVGVKRSDLALAALASAAVPGMQPVAVAAVVPPDDGTEPDHQQALVEDTTGRRWWVRAPLTAVAGAAMQRNDELVRQLARHLPFKVPAPVGYAALGRDGQAAVYPFVEGSPLDLGRLPAGPGLASAVGRAIAAVHNVPRAVFEEQDVPVFDAAGCRQRLTADVDRAAETGRVPTGLLARWEAAFDAAPLWQFATTPVHGSFRGTSVLVVFGEDDDAASGRVVAVTGWEEAQVADPAVDLASTCALASPQAWGSVLDSYALARAQRPDPYLHARARLISETRLLRGLAAAVAEGREDDVRRKVEALRRTDRLTEDDDSLVPVTARSSGATATVVTPAGDSSTPTVADAEEAQPARTDEASWGWTADADAAPAAPPAPTATPDLAPDPDPTMEVASPVPDQGSQETDHVVEVEGPEPAQDTGRATAGPAPAPVDGLPADAHVGLEGPAPDDLALGDVAVEDTALEAAASESEASEDDGVPAPVEAAGSSAGAEVPSDVVEDDLDDLDDQQRLHELYGMPASDPPDPDGGPAPRS
jgi:aminoglycoside phosphotransferase (APT) family kinase protein